jgi:hypothetical protein
VERGIGDSEEGEGGGEISGVKVARPSKMMMISFWVSAVSDLLGMHFETLTVPMVLNSTHMILFLCFSKTSLLPQCRENPTRYRSQGFEGVRCRLYI